MALSASGPDLSRSGVLDCGSQSNSSIVTNKNRDDMAVHTVNKDKHDK